MRQFEIALDESWPAAQWSDITVLCAVSGGADSVALLRAMAANRKTGPGRIVVAHANHGLRGEASDRDAAFVAQLADQLDIVVEVARLDVKTEAQSAGDGIEAAARNARYKFLQETAEWVGARYVVTAHTSDDQAETILHNILRGTGLSGVAGMSRTRTLGPVTTLIRPLLQASRADIVDYLSELGQDYCEDATNLDTSLTRNRIRRELLPLLQREFNPEVGEALRRLGSLASDAQREIETSATKLAEQSIVSRSDSQVVLDCTRLKQGSDYLAREAIIHLWRAQGWPLQSMGYEQWESLATLALASDAAAITMPGNIQAQKKDGQLSLTRP